MKKLWNTNFFKKNVFGKWYYNRYQKSIDETTYKITIIGYNPDLIIQNDGIITECTTTLNFQFYYKIFHKNRIFARNVLSIKLDEKLKMKRYPKNVVVANCVFSHQFGLFRSYHFVTGNILYVKEEEDIIFSKEFKVLERMKEDNKNKKIINE